MATSVFFDGIDVSSYVTGVNGSIIDMTCPNLPVGEYMVTIENENGVSNRVRFTIVAEVDATEGFTREIYHVERGNSRFMHQFKKPNGR